MQERVQRILAKWGIASRREAENLIREKRILINGQFAQLGDKVDPQRDCIVYDGKILKFELKPKLLYILLNKPLGVVSTCFDPQGRPTVLDLLPPQIAKGQGLHPVGRLDIDSTGAILLTNDGNLTLRLTQPRYHLSKTYHVLVEGSPTDTTLISWCNGVMLEGKMTLPAQIKILKKRHQQTLLEIVLSEGRNRQIRNCAQLLGHGVIKLHRVAIGPIELDNLTVGSHRILDDSQQTYLKGYLESAIKESVYS